MKMLTSIIAHFFIILFIGFLLLPLYLAFVAASHEGRAMLGATPPFLPGSLFFVNLKTVLMEGVDAAGGYPVWVLLINSFIMALSIAFGKIIFALAAAFAFVYFHFPYKKVFFGLIFLTLMLPIEVRIIPTFQIVAQLGWLNQFTGLTLPLMASATAVFLFRQFFKTIPVELVDAAILDGASPWHFFKDILLPLSITPMMSLFIILFIYGWNQYLWPLVVATDPSKATIVMGIRYLEGVADLVPQWHYIMCVALLALLPPCLLVMLLQRWFEKGLIY